MNSNETDQTIFTWKGIVNRTTEHCHLSHQSGINIYDGVITGLVKDKAIMIQYKIIMEPLTGQYFIQIIDQKDDRTLMHIRRSEGKWFDSNGHYLSEFEACEDFDISLTPLANSFPINRLNLNIGESKIIQVIYMDVFENKMSVLRQRYSHKHDRKYLYENLNSGFAAELTVDSRGFVLHYANIWERVFYEDGAAKSSFCSALISEYRSTELQEEDDIYAPLLGSWTVVITDLIGETGENVKIGEWHFSRVLEGRAIQDILIAPDRESRSGVKTISGNRYGTILRTFDFKTKRWTMNWFNPVSGVHSVLTARSESGKIIQESEESGGMIMRWVFDKMKGDSFHWYGEHSTDQSNTWKKTVEFFCIRMAGTVK